MSEVMSEGENAFTRKLGPLPVWAWGGIIAAVLWGVYYWRGHSATQATPRFTGAASPTGAGDTSGANQQTQVPYSGTISTFPMAPASPTTNAQWAKNVADQMIALGYAPDSVDNAITSYVNGGTLDSTSKSLVDVALQKYGNAPQGVLPVNSTDNTYIGTRYTVQQGDTLDSIVGRYYGNTNKDITERLLAGNNQGLVWDEKSRSFGVKPGQVLTLGTNGIVNVQSNSLNTYDAGHALPAGK